MKKLFLTIIIFLSFTSLAFAQSLRENFLFDNKVSVLIPDNFSEATPESVASRFTDEANRPQLVYTDSDGIALITMSLVENTGDRETIIHFFRDVKDNLRATYPEHRIITSDVVRNRTLAFVEVLLPNQDGAMLYNMMGFRYVDDKFFSFNFSCPEDMMDKYKDNAREIVKNIKVIKKG